MSRLPYSVSSGQPEQVAEQSTETYEGPTSPDPDAIQPAFRARAPDEGAAREIGFDWSAPCRVPALQWVLKKGQKATLRFDVVLVADGEGLRMRLDDMRFESIAGHSADDPAVQDQLRLARSMMRAVPETLISSDGAFVGVEGMDEAIDEVVAQIRQDDAELARTVEATLRAPQMRATMEQKAGDYWNGWVGAWLGRKLGPGSEVSETASLPTPTGEQIDVPQAFRHHGRVVDHEDLVLLSSEQVVEGEQAEEMMLETLKQMAAQGGREPPPREVVEGFRRVTMLHVAIDPDTGRPHRARYEMRIDLRGNKAVEIRDTAFDWDRATGCGR